jgi:acetamidase/formamidase
VMTVDRGESVRIAVPSSLWYLESGEELERGDAEVDTGHALAGPIAVRGARAGQTLAVTIDEVRPGSWGFTPSADGGVRWELEGDVGRGAGREVGLAPFLGVIGMPPPGPGIHSTRPPRRWGGNIDCKELVSGSTLYLPIPVDGAFLSAGDGHAAQGDGEVAGWAIETPVEAQLTLDVHDDLQLEWPIARTANAWLAFGFDEDLGQAARFALAGILTVMKRELGVTGGDALVLASVGVDLRITQVVNETQGVHAVLRDGAFK